FWGRRGAPRQCRRAPRRPGGWGGFIQGTVLPPPRPACPRRRPTRRLDHVGQAREMFGIRLDHAASSVCCREGDLPEPSPRPTGEGCASLQENVSDNRDKRPNLRYHPGGGRRGGEW